jgi:hypothetical protein
MSNKARTSTLQFRQNVHERARQGQPLSNEEIEQITRETVELAGVDANSESSPYQQFLPRRASKRLTSSSRLDTVVKSNAGPMGGFHG